MNLSHIKATFALKSNQRHLANKKNTFLDANLGLGALASQRGDAGGEGDNDVDDEVDDEDLGRLTLLPPSSEDGRSGRLGGGGGGGGVGPKYGTWLPHERIREQVEMVRDTEIPDVTLARPASIANPFRSLVRVYSPGSAEEGSGEVLGVSGPSTAHPASRRDVWSRLRK